jgi:hypothetical protein
VKAGVHAARAVQLHPPHRRHRDVPGYTDPSKFVDGNPYGTSHVSAKGKNPVDDIARTAEAVQAKRVVTMAGALRDGLARDSVR